MRLLSVLVLGLCLSSLAADPYEQWPGFRGPLQTGVAPHADPPVEWSEEKNILWKTELPGLGHSSPVVWDNQIFLTSAIPAGEPLAEPKYSGRPGAHNNLPITQKQQFVVLAYDRKTGDQLWQTTVNEQLPHEGGHETGTYASASPVTDGERVFAFFGSYGLYCLDGKSGEILWQKDLGDQFTKHGHGEGSSPALWKDTLLVNWDHEEDSYLIAFETTTGEERWRAKREERTSWSTPIIATVDEKPQAIVSATGAVRGYDLNTGKVIWWAKGLSDNVVATPVYGDGILYALSSYTFRAGMAIRIDDGAKGDLGSTDRILWRTNSRTPYIPSPLLYDGILYYLAHYQGVVTRKVGETGDEPTGPFRINNITDVYASPVAAAGKIYFVDRSGLVAVLSNDPEPQLLGSNFLEDSFSATPALVGDQLILRGQNYLYSIGQE